MFSPEDDPGENQFGSSSKNLPYSPDIHLKTAIRIYERQLFIGRINESESPAPPAIRFSADELKSYFYQHDSTFSINSEDYYGYILTPKLSRKGFANSENSQLKENIEIAKQLTLVGDQILFKNLSDSGQKKRLRSSINQFSIPEELRSWYQYRNLWEEIRDDMKTQQIRKNYKFTKISNDLLEFDVITNAFFALLSNNQKDYWIFDYSQVLMLTDTIATRYLSLMYCHLENILKITPMPLVQDLLKVYDWGDSLLKAHGNNAYTYIKDLEPVAIAVFLSKWEKLDISSRFYEGLIDDAKTEPAHERAMRDLFRLFSDVSHHPNILFELFGTYRHFGHPTVDEIKGIEVLKENSRIELPLEEDCLLKVSGAFNRTFILEFIRKHRRWPKVKLIDESKSKDLQTLVKNKPLGFSEYDLDISIQDWANLEFEQEFQFDDFEDFTVLLSDTAISPYRSHWYSIYSKDLTKFAAPPDMEESRRVLIEILKRPKVSCKKIRETIQSQNIPHEWLVIGLHSKERELKIKSRLFAMMVLEMRLYFGMTEKNIAEKIFPYIPFQTMTWTDSDLLKVLLNLSEMHTKNKLRTKTFLSIVFSLDFN